jgi:hypothetical protein
MIATSLPETPFSASTEAQLSKAPMRAIELPSLADLDNDVELPLTHAMESHPTASEAIFHPDTALIPTTTVEKLNDWTQASKVVFSIDIGTSHSVRFLLLKAIASFLPWTRRSRLRTSNRRKNQWWKTYLRGLDKTTPLRRKR